MSTEENDDVIYRRTCMILPPQLNSRSIWGGGFGQFITSALPTLQLQISLIYFGTLFFHTFLGRIRIPRFTSMTIIGIIVGTTYNKPWADDKGKILLSHDSQESLGLISVFGYIMFLFYIGVKTDMSMILKTGRNAMNIGAIAILAPFLCGVVVQKYSSSKYLDPEQHKKLIFLIAMLSIAPFPVISSVLSDLKILNSELGRLGLSSAIVSEMLSIFLASMVAFGNVMVNYGILRALMDIGAAMAFIFVIVIILRPAMFWIIKQTPEGCPVNDHYVYCILILTLLSSYASHQYNFLALYGPYIFGLSIPEGPPLGTAIIKKIDTFVNGVFMPIFVTTCAMRVNLEDLMNWKLDTFMVQATLLVAVTFVAKLVACMLPPLYSRMPFKDAVTLSLIMSCKGIVEMATLSFFRDIAGVPVNVFTLLMMYMILNATILPILLSVLYNPSKRYAGYTKRNIMDLRSNAEFRVLTCIHRPDNIPPAINLLEATYPTREEPLSVYVLHLIELIGRASPVFISHQLQKKTKSRSSFAQNLIDAFESFEQEFKGALVVNTFTAVSPAEMMNDDICMLALDKLTSLIVLPFHQKWSSDGNSIELHDKSLRDLNYSVLERAPCSVGILIERAQMTHIFSLETPYSVCMIFVGGKDDREALFFAKRMTKNPHVRLSVVRFIASKKANEDVKDWDAVLETEMLKDIKMKQKVVDAYVTYREESVKDGPETALIVRTLVNEYDLIIVGRRDGVESPQTCGLLQWSEYPELGVLGDLLAYVPGKSSIFVMQQQRTASEL